MRFTPDSVRRALDAGATADGLLAELAAHSRGPVPQPLEYLVRDAARRHGRLRAGSASSYLRADDPSLLAGLAEDGRLASLGLVRLAPTVLASQAPVRELVDALRAHGLAPVVEGPDGQVLHVVAAGATGRAAEVPPPRAVARRPPPREQLSDERLLALVPQLRRAEEERRIDESERLPGGLLPAPRPAARDRTHDRPTQSRTAHARRTQATTQSAADALSTAARDPAPAVRRRGDTTTDRRQPARCVPGRPATPRRRSPAQPGRSGHGNSGSRRRVGAAA